MKKINSEQLLNRSNMREWGREPEFDSTRLFIFMCLIIIFIINLVLVCSLDLGDAVVEVTERKNKKLEYPTLALFYVNLFFVLNSLISGGFAAITDVDILDAVKGATSAQSVQYIQYV